MISNKGLVTISAFMSSCDDLINGKFIFAGNKVANILKAINESPELYEVISECLKEFNYEKEFGRAKIKLPTKKGTFKMPEENTIKIPLVFCMLVEIQENKIDFKQFLADYFDTDEDRTQFEVFAEQVIVPFKDAIAYLFDIEGQNKFKPQPKEEDIKPQHEIFKPVQKNSKAEEFNNTVKEICDDLLSELECVKVKEEYAEDIKYIVETLKKEIERNYQKVVNPLIIGCIYAIKKVRKLRFYERRFRDAMEELYL